MQQFVLIVLTILEQGCLELRKMCYAHFLYEKSMLHFECYRGLVCRNILMNSNQLAMINVAKMCSALTMLF